MASKSTYRACALAFQEFSQSWKTVKGLNPQTVATTKITFYKFADYCQVLLSLHSHTAEAVHNPSPYPEKCLEPYAGLEV